MSKKKLHNLNKYSQDLKDKLASPTPAKHVGHPESYKGFLQRELSQTTKQIEELKATVTK